jgi:hypothetical protein
MRLSLPNDIARLQNYIPRFIALIGVKAWDKRAAALLQQARGTPAQSHVVERYHWLELELAHLRQWRRKAGKLSPRMESAASISALRFAAAVVEIHARSSERARAELRGRLRDAMKSDSGFAPIYLEALHVVNSAVDRFDVTLPDLEDKGRHDLHFEDGEIAFNIECKHISADAGRRIHQKDFYRLMHNLFETMVPPGRDREVPTIILVTLDDRLPAADARQRELTDAIRDVAAKSIGTTASGTFFEISKLSYAAHFGLEPVLDRTLFQQRVQECFGANCHSVTTGDRHAGLTVILRSLVEDDHTKPQLEALKLAARQLPKNVPAFVSVQFDDLDFSELLYPHVTDRLQLLSAYFFETRESSHIAAALFNAYRPAAHLSPEEEWNPIVACWNPQLDEDWKAGLPFQEGVDPGVARSLSSATLPRKATRFEFNKSPSSAAWRRRAAHRSE